MNEDLKNANQSEAQGAEVCGGTSPQPTTSEDLAFWALLVISQIWGSWSIGKGGVAVFASVPWLVMAFAVRWPYWKRLLNYKRA
jgi:hypothetical protein